MKKKEEKKNVIRVYPRNLRVYAKYIFLTRVLLKNREWTSKVAKSVRNREYARETPRVYPRDTFA